MDLHGVLDELYELAPQDFTEARNAAATSAREAGNREAADRIRTLRRPTLSAWAGNLLVRHDAEAVQAVLHLGEALREAHRTLDAVRLRELGSRRHQVVAALARRAADLAAERGHPLGDAALHEIEATVHVVLADPEAAREWADGHMARPLTEPVGFTAATVDLAAAPARRPPSEPPRAEDAGFLARRPGPAEPRETAAERAAGEAAGRAAEAALLTARRSAREQQAAALAAERAQEAVRDAEARADSLADQLARARETLRARRTAAEEARDRARAAATDAAEARARADEAALRAERLAPAPRPR
ncbi:MULTISPECIES: hypothetical protein [unclassified Streptomyces]|uniref:hypothetical protein n=1 Tax=unclassified Streptomyces TaxID=2593676 RepID=UPI0033C6C9AC